MSGSVQGKTYIVTGAAGMLGSFVVDRLAELGAEVIALDIAAPREGFGHSPHPAVRDVSVDISDRDALAELVKGCSGIVHIAAMLTRVVKQYPVRGFEVNVGGTLHLLEAAANEGMERFVLASSGATYGRAAPDGGGLKESAPLLGRSFYAASKIASELYAEVYAHERSLEFMAFRLGTMYGPRLGPNGNVASYLHAAANDAGGGTVRVPLDPNDSEISCTPRMRQSASCAASCRSGRISHSTSGPAVSPTTGSSSVRCLRRPEAMPRSSGIRSSRLFRPTAAFRT